MKRNRYILLILRGMTFLSILGSVGCGLFSGGQKVLNELPETREINGAIEIGNEWSEINPQPPMKSTQQFQFIGLKLNNIKDWDKNDKKVLVFNDGSKILIQVELSDELGNKYSLIPVRIGEYTEFGRDKSNIPLSAPPTDQPDFPINRLYTKIKIRSDRPVKCDQIIWRNFTFW